MLLIILVRLHFLLQGGYWIRPALLDHPLSRGLLPGGRSDNPQVWAESRLISRDWVPVLPGLLLGGLVLTPRSGTISLGRKVAWTSPPGGWDLSCSTTSARLVPQGDVGLGAPWPSNLRL